MIERCGIATEHCHRIVREVVSSNWLPHTTTPASIFHHAQNFPKKRVNSALQLYINGLAYVCDLYLTYRFGSQTVFTAFFLENINFDAL